MDSMVPYQELASQIFFLRGRKVMLDFHLAALYETETRILKQQVKRNLSWFPIDLMFQLTAIEVDSPVSQNVIPSKSPLGGALPFAFTEQGVAMLSGVLRSEKAIQVNIAIMRAFVRMRELIDENKDLRKKLDEMEGKYDQQFQVVFDAIRQLVRQKEEPRIPIGFTSESK